MNKKHVHGKTGFIIANKINGNYIYGYINNLGKKILDLQYDEVVRLQNDSSKEDAYLVAFKNGKAGIYKNSNLIIEHEYQDIEYDNSNKILIVQKNQKYGIVDLTGKIKIPIEYDNILIAGDCINTQKGEDITLYHPDGTKFESIDFVSMFSTENNKYIICINKDDYYGVLDKNESQLIENKYTLINYLWDDYFIAQYNNKFGIINSKGKKVLDFKYDLLQKVENLQVIEAIINNQTNIINKDLKTQLELGQANIIIENDYIEIFSLEEKQIVYLDKLGNIIDSKDVLKANKLFAKKQDDKWGFADITGKLKIEAKYDMVTDFNKYGYAGINVNGKWGVIDEAGNILQEPKYNLDDAQIPNFIGKYYEEYLGYGERFFKSVENT